jgi:hypothetical protein
MGIDFAFNVAFALFSGLLCMVALAGIGLFVMVGTVIAEIVKTHRPTKRDDHKWFPLQEDVHVRAHDHR